MHGLDGYFFCSAIVIVIYLHLLSTKCLFFTKNCTWLFAANFNSYMSYAYMCYRHPKGQSWYVPHYPHCMPSYHGFPWVIYLNHHW